MFQHEVLVIFIDRKYIGRESLIVGGGAAKMIGEREHGYGCGDIDSGLDVGDSMVIV